MSVHGNGKTAVLALLEAGEEAEAIAQVLTQARFPLHRARSPREALRLAEKEPGIGILLAEFAGRTVQGTEVLTQFAQHLPQRRFAPVFLADATHPWGAFPPPLPPRCDVLDRPIEPARLVQTMRRADARLRQGPQTTGATDHPAEQLAAVRAVIAQLAEWLQPSDGSTADRAMPDIAQATAPLLAAKPLRAATQAAAIRSHIRTGGSVAERHLPLAQNGLRAARGRAQVLGERMASSPEWTILLELYVKAVTGGSVTVSSLGLASGARPTTALRRLEELLEMGLVRRVRDLADARRVVVELTEEGRSRMWRYFETLHSHDIV